MGAERPNILLIVSDDHGYADRSARGSADARTPQLDRLAREGVSFDSAYVTAPICSPSRAGLIAGAHQQRWGADWFDSSSFPPTGTPVMPEVLRAAGYRTGYFGKVHYGAEEPGDRACPERHGFDESLYGLAGQSMGRLHYLQHSQAEAAADAEAARVNGTHPLRDAGRPVDCDQHLTTAFADRAIAFMGDGAPSDDAGPADTSARDAPAARGAVDGASLPGGPAAAEAAPFFCMVAFNAVHNFAWQLPRDELDARALPRREDFDPALGDYVDWYDGAISPRLEHGRDYYLAQLELMDREIGRLLDHLEDTGRRRSTLVVYLTDNGGSTCNFGDNAPLHGTKYSLFEGGIRVPLLVSWPDAAPQGAASDALVSALDLLPTFASAAGARTPDGVDGQDLRPVWEGRSPGHEEIHADTGFQWSVRTRDWKLRWVDPDDAGHRAHLLDVEHTDIGSGTTLVPVGASVDEAPGADVAAEHPQVVADLIGRHRRWRRRVGRDA